MSMWSATAIAQERPSSEASRIAEPPARVAIPGAHVRVFEPAGNTNEKSARRLHSKLKAGAVRYVANHTDTYTLISPEKVAAAVKRQPVFGRKLEVAEGWAEQGTEAYKSLNFNEAIDKFEKAVANYDDIRYQLVNPDRVAEVMMYLSLSYLSAGGNAARPLALIRRMVILEPSRVLEQGYYPKDIVSFYESTRRDALDRLRQRGPSPERAEWVVETTESDFTAFLYAFPVDSGPSPDETTRYEVALWIYSAKKGEMLKVRRIGAPGVPAAKLRAAANRLMSRVATCVYEKPEETGNTLVKSAGRSPYSINIGVAYASYLRYPEPIEQPFGNIGFDFGASAQITQELGLVLGGQVMSSLRDYSGRLVDGFTTMRFYAGPDLGVQLGPLNLGGHLALEVAGMGDFAVCTNLEAVPQGCNDPANRESYGDVAVAGITARPRVRLDLVPAFSLMSGASISYYVLPFPERRLGFPVSFDFGVKYQF